MSSVVAHAVSASLIALTAAHVDPNETGYVVTALVSGAVVDLDHLIYVVRDWEMYHRHGFRGHLHHARSAFHELLGLLLVGIVVALLFPQNQPLAKIIFVAFTVHLIEDWILGKSSPFIPVDQTITQFFALSFRQKVVADILILAVAGTLWMIYLAGGL